MRASDFAKKWTGTVLVLAGIVATLWLAATGKLTLYVHPRYELFTVLLALVGGASAVGALAAGIGAHHRTHVEHVTSAAKIRPWRRIWNVATSLVLVCGAIFVLLIAPPATLSTSLAGQRDVADSSANIGAARSVGFIGADTTSFSVKDWAILLNSGDPTALIGKPASLTGFVIDTKDPDVFFVARYLISCCAVDAQPVGVPVYERGWAARYPVGTWVDTTGTFTATPDPAISPDIVLIPQTVKLTVEPENPYVY